MECDFYVPQLKRLAEGKFTSMTRVQMGVSVQPCYEHEKNYT